MIEWLRIRRLAKALKFYNVFEGFSDAEIRDKIKIQRIRNSWIDGVNYIYRALNPADFLAGLDIALYNDEKDKRRMEQDQRRAEKNPEYNREKEEKFKEHAFDVLNQALIYPDKERFPVSDLYRNPAVFGSLYNSILLNSLGKKKMNS